MAIPDYQTLMRPVLGLALDKEAKALEIIEKIADQFELTEEECDARLSSGQTTVLSSRVHWAITYMAQAALMKRVRRGVVIASDLGRQVFKENPDRIDNNVLAQFEEFRAFKERSRVSKRPSAYANETMPGLVHSSDEARTSPEERIDSAVEEISAALRDELLARIVSADPTFFEHVIIDLMLAMGYGGSGSSKHLGKTADGGIDGVINEDPLGLDIVFLQAKRYAEGNIIAVSQIREFAGSLDEKGAVKGVFVTTSSFAGPAKVYAERSPKRLILIDGQELTRLLVRYSVGVRSFRVVDLKRIDEDYFAPSDG